MNEGRHASWAGVGVGEECQGLSWLGIFRNGNAFPREVTQKLVPTGARPQPRVHFQRRALRLPENTSYSALTAFLTAASSPSEVDSFPYLQGLDGNGTGNWSLSSFWAGLLGFSLSVCVSAVARGRHIERGGGRVLTSQVLVGSYCYLFPAYGGLPPVPIYSVIFANWLL